MTEQAPANWYPDPFGRHELRYWDGVEWTHHVASQGTGSIDVPVMTAPGTRSPTPAAAKGDKRVQRDVKQAGIVAGARPGGGSLLTEPVLVVNQIAKLIEVNAEYNIYNQHGQAIGTVREYGQSLVKKALKVDQFTSRRLQMLDLSGQVVLSLLAPATFIMAKVVVLGADGVEVGRILQKFGILNAHFALMSGKQTLGSINGEGWDSWDFNVQDAEGREIARITKKWAGFATERFTRADNYVVEIHGELDSRLRSLVVASALVIDAGLRQGQSKVRDRSIREAQRPPKVVGRRIGSRPAWPGGGCDSREGPIEWGHRVSSTALTGALAEMEIERG